MNILFWSMASQGKGISGGDRIYMEFIKNWYQKIDITVITWQEGIEMMSRNSVPLDKIKKAILKVPIGFPNYITRILISLKYAFLITSNFAYIYSSSEFWMDSLACAVVKLRHPKTIWVATWYQTAPNPFIGYSLGRSRMRALLYWLVQFPIKPIIKHLADYVLVNNTLETKQFPKHHQAGRAIVILGAVDTSKIDQFLKKFPHQSKKYSAVFQGRFHPQKGVIELIDIWNQVVKKIPTAKLALIGDGPLFSSVKKKIIDLQLETNVELFGYLFDGDTKYSIFNQSQLVVHPAYFDSGGMASAEAMAFGLPCIGFDLPAYSSYYPQGMLKVPLGDTASFSREVIKLLSHPNEAQKLGKVAKNFIYSHYTWKSRALNTLDAIIHV